MQTRASILHKNFLNSKLGLFDPLELLIVEETATVEYTLQQFRLLSLGSAAVVNSQGQLSGIFTERDALMKVAPRLIDSSRLPMSSVMTEKPYTLSSRASIARALYMMAHRGFRHIPILQEDTIKGIISIKDFIVYLHERLIRSREGHPEMFAEGNSSVETFLGSSIAVLSPPQPKVSKAEDSLDQVLRMMRKHNIGSSIVTEQSSGKVLGIFTERDFVSRVSHTKENLAKIPVSEVMTVKPKTLSQTASVSLALQVLSEGGFRHLPVVDSSERILGVLSAKNFIDYLAHSIVEDLEAQN